jgi:hypothetical protein
MQREAKVTYFKELSEHLHDWTGENHKKANVDIRPRTHYYRIRNIICNHMWKVRFILLLYPYLKRNITLNLKKR